MDPTATLTELLDALRAQDRDAATARLTTLLDGLNRGGAFPAVPVAPPSPRYQGWANHATWAVSLWLNNDEGTYRFCRGLAREAAADADGCEQVNAGIWTVAQARRFILADRLSESVAEQNPLTDSPSLFGDLLTAALDDVNWDEVAAGFIEDLEP